MRVSRYLPKLPQGSRWQHFFSKKSYLGGSNVTVPAPLDEFPLFTIEAGSD
jgi:alpha-glucosidase (family GH31 glycosyl hydrolase)